MDKDKIIDLLNNLERIANNAMEMARNRMDDEPGMIRQNQLWRLAKQDAMDLRKELKDIIETQ